MQNFCYRAKIQILTPVVACDVSPLEHALSAGQIFRELIVHLKDFGTWAWIVPAKKGFSAKIQRKDLKAKRVEKRTFGKVTGMD